MAGEAPATPNFHHRPAFLAVGLIHPAPRLWARLRALPQSLGMEIPLLKLDPDLPSPVHAHPGDAGTDLLARRDVTLAAGEWQMVPTGVAVAIPSGYVGLVAPRSGLAARHGIGVVNAPGVIDAGYRGEINVILINFGTSQVQLRRGERIAQLVVLPVVDQQFVESDTLPPSSRGGGGFGSTGR